MKISRLKKHIRKIIKEQDTNPYAPGAPYTTIFGGIINDFLDSGLQLCMDPCAINTAVGTLPNMMHNVSNVLPGQGGNYWFQNGDCSGQIFGFPDEDNGGSSLYNPTSYLAWINWWDNQDSNNLSAFCMNETGNSVFGADTFGADITMQQFTQYLAASNLDTSCCAYAPGWGVTPSGEEDNTTPTILGCMNSYADNFNPEATEPDPAVVCCSETGAGGLPPCTGGGNPGVPDDFTSTASTIAPMKEPSKDIPTRIVNKRGPKKFRKSLREALIEIGFGDGMSKDIDAEVSDKFEDFGVRVGQLYSKFETKDITDKESAGVLQKIMDLISVEDESELVKQIDDLEYLIDQLPDKPESKDKIGFNEQMTYASNPAYIGNATPNEDGFISPVVQSDFNFNTDCSTFNTMAQSFDWFTDLICSNCEDPSYINMHCECCNQPEPTCDDFAQLPDMFQDTICNQQCYENTMLSGNIDPEDNWVCPCCPEFGVEDMPPPPQAMPTPPPPPPPPQGRSGDPRSGRKVKLPKGNRASRNKQQRGTSTKEHPFLDLKRKGSIRNKKRPY